MWTRYHWLAVTFCLIAFTTSALVARFVYEQVPHIEDEVAYYFQAQVFAQGKAYVDTPPQANCFSAPFIVDYQGKRFGKYPPGWSLLLAIGIDLGQPWWVASICTAITIALFFRLGSEIGGRVIGLLAAGLAIASPYVLFLSGSLMSHAGALLFASTFFWCYRRVVITSHRRWAIVAGLALGCVYVIRPFTAVAVAIPIGIDVLIRAIRTRNWQTILSMVVGFVPLALIVPFFNNIWTGNPLASTYELVWEFDKVGFGVGYGIRPEGHTWWFGLGVMMTELGRLATQLHGVPLLSLVFVFAALLFKPRRFWDWMLGATALSLALMHTLYWTGYTRYYYEASFAWFILSALGIVRVWNWFKQRSVRQWRTYCAALVLMLGIDLFLYLPQQLQANYGFYGITGKPRTVLTQAHLTNAWVVVRGSKWQDYAVPFILNTPTYDGTVVYANNCGNLSQVLARYPGRRVYYFDARTMMLSGE